MTKFQKIKKLVSRHTKDFPVISEHILLQNCGALAASFKSPIPFSASIILPCELKVFNKFPIFLNDKYFNDNIKML